MTDVVLDDTGQRALITDLETGEVFRVSVPTAKENVANGRGRFAHGEAKGPAPVVQPELAAAEPVITLTEPDVLPLPEKPRPSPKPHPDREKRDADIAAAFELLNEFDFVENGERKGRPKCSAVENIVGYPVFVKEVDPLWNAREG